MPGEEKPLQILINAGMISVCAALVTALVKEGKIGKKSRTWAAGLCCGILAGWILRNSHLDQFYKDVIISLGAAFVTSIWRVCEIGIIALLKKYFKISLNKKDDTLENNKPD